MGQKDSSEKLLEDYNDVFADIVNVLLFNGREVVKTEELSEAPTDSQYKAMDDTLHEQERDVAKYWEKCGIRIAMYGLENQTGQDKDMPMRVFNYEGAAYRSQLTKEEKINKRYPVVTLVLYFGLNHWSAPMSLYEMLDIPDGLQPYINDFKINLFEIAYLSNEQVKMFTSDFGIVAEYFSTVRKGMDPQTCMGQKKILHVDEMLKLMTAMTGDRRFLETVASLPEGGNGMDITMSTVLDQIENKGIKKGIKKGSNEKGIRCYINCRKRGLSEADSQQIAEISDDIVCAAEKQYLKNK